VCLRCQQVEAPVPTPSPALETAIVSCAAGLPDPIVVVKARPRRGGDSRSCEECGRAAEPALLDLALGEHGGLVAEETRGFFCWTCGIAVVPDSAAELRGRLAGLVPAADDVLEPSLLYDTPTHPRALQLEITTRCNLHCAYCGHRNLPVKRDVSLEQLRRTLDNIDVERVDDVDFTGLGEPLLNAALPDMLCEVTRRGDPHQLRVVTNGTALTRRRFEPLCEAGLTSLSVSIDSLDPERFARARADAKLSTVLRNLEALVAYREREQLGHLRIKIKAVLVDDLYDTAEQMLRYSAGLGLEMPHFSRLDGRGVAQELYSEPWLVDDWTNTPGDLFTLWCTGRWEELTGGDREPVEPTAPLRPEIGFDHPGLRPPDVCRWAVDAAFVAFDGSCLSCCEQMIDVPRLEWGSVHRTPLAELWNGPILWAYRLPLSLGVVPERCVGCSWAPRDGMALIATR
jgi:uncharacterized Fe-S cluster-containing radical SAM superfamily protein